MKIFKTMVLTMILALAGCTPAFGPLEVETTSQDESRGTSASIDFRKQVIYFAFVDRFADGDTGNNNGNNASQYDTANWKKYWGGDLQGLINKLDYLKAMGVTAIWVTPLVNNVDSLQTDGTAPYHGYWGKDFTNIDEHNGSWAKFDELVTKMHSSTYNMKLILDYAPNHSNPNDQGDKGALWKTTYDASGNPVNTVKLTDYTLDTAGAWYHRNGGVTDWTNWNQVQNYNLFNLSDFNQDNSNTSAYLIDALTFWAKRGVDAVRVDAIKHMPKSFVQNMISGVTSAAGKDMFFFGEWFGASAWVGSGVDYNAKDYANTSGSSLLDFGYRDTMERVLVGRTGNTMYTLSQYLKDRESYWTNPLDQVVFLDNHDMARISTALRSSSSTFGPGNNEPGGSMTQADAAARLRLGVAVTLTVRGVPCIYYGTEQYAANFTSNSFGQVGGDPYNREWQPAWDTTTPVYKTIKALSDLKQINPALQDGTYTEKYVTNDILVYERKSGNNVAEIMVNRGGSATITVPNLSLPAGTYTNVLGTNTVTVSAGSATVTLGTNDVVVLSYIYTATPPAAPTNLTVTSVAGTTVNLGWTASTGATSYVVSRATSESGTYTDATTVTGTTAGVSGLNANTQYWFKVRAVNASGTSANTPAVTATTTYAANWPSMYLRGSFNSWGTTTPMTLVGNNTWQASVTLAASTAYTYKYDALGNWASSSNWGSSGTAGIAALGGGNISYTSSSAGTYTFTFNDSTRAYTVASSGIAAPVFNPAPGAVAGGTVVTITSSTAGTTIYYTVDGSTPTTSSPSGNAGSGTASVTVNAALTLKAMAVKSGLPNSSVTSGSYTLLQAATPTFNPAGGAVSAGTVVTISSATAGSTIYYTVNGTTPTTSSPSGAAGSAQATVTVSAGLTIKAIAVKSGYLNSTQGSATYTIGSTSGTLTVNFVVGSSSQNVTFPGDANNWSLTANTLSTGTNQTYTVTWPGAVTTTNLARGNSTSALELKVCNVSGGWNGAWGFGTWTKSSNITFSDGNSQQIAIAAAAGQNVTLTINVTTSTLTAVVQ